uniref:Uncharacterized protein n=1 Tax=Picea glauca TaxID=3330 RepID=A0A101M1G1_PICGL|nr:hypothetical protein ABT39_MTgene3804 [Picea glauca]
MGPTSALPAISCPIRGFLVYPTLVVPSNPFIQCVEFLKDRLEKIVDIFIHPLHESTYSISRNKNGLAQPTSLIHRTYDCRGYYQSRIRHNH